MPAPTLRQLHEAAHTCRNAGLSTIPVSGKRPVLSSWSTYQERLPDEAELASWYGQSLRTPPTGMAVVCGNVSHGHVPDGALMLIDVDRADLIESFEARAGTALDSVHIRETGSGKRHYVVLTDAEIVAHNRPLARYRDKDTGKIRAGIETRENHGYFVALGEHPDTHGFYRPLIGDLAHLSLRNVDQALTLLEVARSFDEIGTDDQEAARRPYDKDTSDRLSLGKLIIDTFNAANPVGDVLSRYGYIHTARHRYRRPGGKSSSVTLREDHRGQVSYHYSSSDELFQKQNVKQQPVHDAFEIERLLNPSYRGEMMRALRGIGQQFGIRLYDLDDVVAPTPKPVVPGLIGTDGTITLLDRDDTNIIVLVDDDASARALYELGCAVMIGPRTVAWPQTWLDIAQSRQKRFLWMTMPLNAVIDRLSIELRAGIVQTTQSAQDHITHGATDIDIASLLLAARVTVPRVGLKAALKNRLR